MPMPPLSGGFLPSPGNFVCHPQCPDWGVGQVQSVIGNRITVNFENAGKRVINGAVIGLEPARITAPDR